MKLSSHFPRQIITMYKFNIIMLVDKRIKYSPILLSGLQFISMHLNQGSQNQEIKY